MLVIIVVFLIEKKKSEYMTHVVQARVVQGSNIITILGIHLFFLL